MIVDDSLILSKSFSETGSYNLHGSITQQRNTGVLWLTKYTDMSKYSIRHIKSSFTKDRNILILWENRKNNVYENTYGMKVDINGKILVQPFKLRPYVRLDRRNNNKWQDPHFYK
jgi:hypothetical protein